MKKRVSLVLGSGGARGYAHIGVIEELEKSGYEIVSISGASMGALIGGLYACGKLQEYKEWVAGLNAINIATLLDISFSRGGIIEGEKVFQKLYTMIEDQKIEELPIKFTAVATDLVKKKEVWFQHGDLLKAIRASIAIPSIFTPVKMGGMILIDGGALNPLPIAPTNSDLTDTTIAVNLYGDISKPKPETDIVSSPKFSMLEILDKTLDTMQNALTRYRISGYPPDIMINIPIDVCNTIDFHKAKEVIEVGRTIAKKILKDVDL
jgi:NTE family protein